MVRASKRSLRAMIRVRASARVENLDGQLLVPGFIDTQVNGGGGMLFNDAPDSESIRAIGAAHRRYRHDRIPAHADQRRPGGDRARDRRRPGRHRRQGVPGVLGIHIEGPFLNRGRRGVHDAKHLRKLGCGRRAAAVVARDAGERW